MMLPCPACGRPIDTRLTIVPAHTEHASERGGFVRECAMSTRPMLRTATTEKTR